MTLDESIRMYRKASENDRCCNKEEAQQLAEWLEELKQLRKEKCITTIKVKEDDLQNLQKIVDKALDGFEVNIEYNVKEIKNKAIDDFTEQLKNSLIHNYKHFLTRDTDGFDWLTTDAVNTHIDEVAKQLKEGR